MAPFPSSTRNGITQLHHVGGGRREEAEDDGDPDSHLDLAGLQIIAVPETAAEKKRLRSSGALVAMARPFSIHLLPERQLLRFVPPFHPTFPFPSSSPSPGNLMMNSGSFNSFDRHICYSSERDLHQHQHLCSLSSSATSLVLSATSSLLSSTPTSSSSLPSSPPPLLSVPDASLSPCVADVSLFVHEPLPEVVAACSCLQASDLARQQEDTLIRSLRASDLAREQEDARAIRVADVDDSLTSVPTGDLEDISSTSMALDPEFKAALRKNELARSSSWKQAKLYRYATKPQFAHGREDLRRYNSRRSVRCRADQICKAFARGRDSSLSVIQLCNNRPQADEQHFTNLRIPDPGDEGEKENISSPSRALQMFGNSSSPLSTQHSHSNTSSSSTSPRRRLPIFEQICPSAQ